MKRTEETTMLGHHRFLTVLSFISLLALNACTLNDGQRCPLTFPNCGSNNSTQTFSSTAGPTCEITGIPVEGIPAGKLAQLTLTAQGGEAPYQVATPTGPKTFFSSTTIEGGFRNPGRYRSAVLVQDSNGERFTCSLDINVFKKECKIVEISKNYNPYVDEDLQLELQSPFNETGESIVYEFIPDTKDPAARNVGYTLATTKDSANLKFAYATPGKKHGVLLITQGEKLATCSADFIVPETKIAIEGGTASFIDGSGNNKPIELTVSNEGFRDTVSYSYELNFGNEHTSLDTSDPVRPKVESTTEVYQELELVITATDGKIEKVKKVSLFFVPTTRCDVAVNGSKENRVVIAGHTVKFTVENVENGESFEVTDVELGKHAKLVSRIGSDGVYDHPVEARFHKSGERDVIILAQTDQTKAACVDNDGNLVSVRLDVRTPVRCLARGPANAVEVGQDIPMEVKVPSNAGIGPYKIQKITSSRGAGLTMSTDDTEAIFNAGEVGRQSIRLASGRPGSGKAYYVRIEVADLGDPEGARYTCTTKVWSKLSASQAMCFAHFERQDGRKITKARARDAGIALVAGPNFADSARYFIWGSPIINGGNYGSRPTPAFFALSYDRRNLYEGGNADTRVGVYANVNGRGITRTCTAPLDIIAPLSCHIDEPGFSEFTIDTLTKFPGAITTPNLGQHIITYSAHVSNGNTLVTNYFDDKSTNGKQKVTAESYIDEDENGFFSKTVELKGKYTKHGVYPTVENRVTDLYDPRGASCSTAINLTAHLRRTAEVWGSDVQGDRIPVPTGTRCFIRAINISRPTDLDNGVATLWLFGHEAGKGAKLINRDCHELQPSVHDRNKKGPYKPVYGTTETSCTIEFVPRDGYCKLQAKALGKHPHYANPGDWRVLVWATSSDKTKLLPNTKVYRLPDLLQRR